MQTIGTVLVIAVISLVVVGSADARLKKGPVAQLCGKTDPCIVPVNQLCGKTDPCLVSIQRGLTAEEKKEK